MEVDHHCTSDPPPPQLQTENWPRLCMSLSSSSVVSDIVHFLLCQVAIVISQPRALCERLARHQALSTQCLICQALSQRTLPSTSSSTRRPHTNSSVPLDQKSAPHQIFPSLGSVFDSHRVECGRLDARHWTLFGCRTHLSLHFMDLVWIFVPQTIHYRGHCTIGTLGTIECRADPNCNESDKCSSSSWDGP